MAFFKSQTLVTKTLLSLTACSGPLCQGGDEGKDGKDGGSDNEDNTREGGNNDQEVGNEGEDGNDDRENANKDDGIKPNSNGKEDERNRDEKKGENENVEFKSVEGKDSKSYVEDGKPISPVEISNKDGKLDKEVNSSRETKEGT